jgi:hypothetical protein
MMNEYNDFLDCTSDEDEGMVIPKDHFVMRAELDCEEPYCLITTEEARVFDEVKVLVPKPLAYYLSTHFCGSHRMQRSYFEQGRNAVRREIKEALGLLDED